MAKKKANKRPRRPERSRRKGRTMAKKDAIKWFNYPKSSRCKIPRRLTKSVVYWGVIGLMFGFVFAHAAHMFVPPGIDYDDLFRVTGLFGLIWPAWFLAMAVLFGGKSLLFLLGRIELVIDVKRFCVITRLGPFWRTRRCSLSQLARFQIEDMHGLFNPRADGVDDWPGESHWNLLAVQKNGRKLKILHCYPKEIVSQLCQDLPDQLRRFLPQPKQTKVAKFSSSAPTVEIHGVGPFDIRDRRQLPLGSDFRVEQHGEEQRVILPRLGFRKTTNLLGKIVLPLILLMELFLMLGFSGWFAGNLQEGGWPDICLVLWSVSTPFFIWQTIIRIRAAICHGSISVTNHQLILRQRDLYGEHLAEWNLTAVESVDIHANDHEAQDLFGKLHTYFSYQLYVTPSSSKRHSWFRNRPKEQLEWIRTWIHDQLPADAEKPVSPRKSV